MKIAEIEGVDAEKQAADNLKRQAQQKQQQDKAAQAKVKMKTAQKQMVAATVPTSTK
jgi:hypothetical protein